MKSLRNMHWLLGVVALTFNLAARNADPESAGLSSARLAEIPANMRQFVDKQMIAGAVTLVARHGQVASLEAVGFADLEQKKPMRTDALFWIASMTKPITATAVLMLQDEGKLNVEDPVEKYLPEFRNQWMIQDKTGTNMVLVRPPRAITLRDLLTHTSGLNDLPSPRPHASLAELVVGYSQLPLKFVPGSKWEYCNAGINTLGRIVEVAAGMPYAEFLQSRLFKPLGMKDTTFWPSGSQLKRIATAYAKTGDGPLTATNVYFVKGNLDDRQRTAFPAGGLYSTAPDLCKLYQMVLNGGEYGGKRYVSREAVAQMTRTQTGEIKTGFVEGMSFGFGWAVVKQPVGVTASLSTGTFGHGGAYGTQGWVDPQADMIYVMLIQRAKLANGDASEMRQVFQDTAARAKLDARPAGK